jgi:hypothetical protein
MNNTIAMEDKVARLEREVSSIKRLLQRLLVNVERGDEAQRQAAGAELAAFLNQVHERLPDVSEEEAERDILEAIQAVRKGA